MSVLTLLTDFGVQDYYVAAVKGTVLRLAPGTTLVDVSHDLPAGDIAGAAFLLGASWRHFPPGSVHLAVVDPGVGSARRMLAVVTPEASFVAPDNGLLTPVLNPPLDAAGSAGAAPAVYAVDRPDLYLPQVGDTFHGRDRFAPIAAYLLRGEPAAELGPRIEDPVRLAGEPPRRQRDPLLNTMVLLGTVVHVDRFGNLVTDIPTPWLDRPLHQADVAGHSLRRWVSHYGQLPAGEPGLLPGSLGTLEASLRDDDLAARWQIRRGDPVRITLSAASPDQEP